MCHRFLLPIAMSLLQCRGCREPGELGTSPVLSALGEHRGGEPPTTRAVDGLCQLSPSCLHGSLRAGQAEGAVQQPKVLTVLEMALPRLPARAEGGSG